MLDDTIAQKEVLLPASGQGARRTLDDTSSRDRLSTPELLARQVEFHTAGQAVPPVEAMLGPVEVHLTDHEIAAENIVDDQGCEVAVPPGRVAGIPVGLVVRSQSVRRDQSLTTCVFWHAVSSQRPSSCLAITYSGAPSLSSSGDW